MTLPPVPARRAPSSHARPRLLALIAVVSIGLLAGACSPIAPSPTPAPSSPATAGPLATPPAEPSPTPSPTAEPLIPAAHVIACVGIQEAECLAVAGRVRAALPVERGAPFSIEITLYGCEQPPCAGSLAAQDGYAQVDWPGPLEPVRLTLGGPPEDPVIGIDTMTWTQPLQPSSERVLGPGPIPFELGHCGLLWQVDFDGSFWVPLGVIDGNAAALIGGDRGHISLVEPNTAEFRAQNGFVASLVRYPGPKRVWPCR